VKAHLKIQAPVTPSHLKHKKKAELARQRELDEIQRKNRILYNKMAYMKPSKFRITHRLDLYHPDNLQKAPSHGTLNLNVRVRELSRIDRANEVIKNKLVEQTTHYPLY
jgi:hypothetical protein